jgi:hypothetical protein
MAKEQFETQQKSGCIGWLFEATLGRVIALNDYLNQVSRGKKPADKPVNKQVVFEENLDVLKEKYIIYFVTQTIKAKLADVPIPCKFIRFSFIPYNAFYVEVSNIGTHKTSSPDKVVEWATLVHEAELKVNEKLTDKQGLKEFQKEDYRKILECHKIFVEKNLKPVTEFNT